MTYRIKEIREKIGMSQDALAEKSGVSRVIISNLETGVREVTTTKTLVKIANALGVDVRDIFYVN